MSNSKLQSNKYHEVSSSDESSKDLFEADEKTYIISGKKEQPPPCKYGRNCYRKNPDHLKSYMHPADNIDEPPTKRRKTDEHKMTADHAVGSNDCEPFNFFLLKVNSIEPLHNSLGTVGITGKLNELFINKFTTAFKSII